MFTDLEKQVLGTVNDAVSKGILESLGRYQSPLHTLINEIIESHRPELKLRFESAIKKAIGSKEFNMAVEEAFHHKLAKSLVAHFAGTVDKAFNAMKNDPTVKAQAILAIERIIKEQ